jgi:hypothetical protein
MDGEVDELAEIRLALVAVRERHEALSAEVEILQGAAVPNQLMLARLKKRKLFLKDQIVRLENQLTPDLIA